MPKIYKLISIRMFFMLKHGSLSLIPLMLLFISSCIDKPTAPSNDPFYPGMKRISSKNNEFQQGSLDPWAAGDEKPPITVRFTYDFWIDTSEVTLHDFYALTRYIPSEYKKSEINKRTPVCYVTWYDAILFCNERSKKSGLDTVYSYTHVERNADGKVYQISGLHTDLTRLGYRLPTEAEWEYSSSANTREIFPWGNEPDSIIAEKYAWYERNSGDSAHTVCSLLPNRFGLYDMFGNAMEWVNDIKCGYQNDTLYDFAGALYSDFEERVVKGGGFVHSIEKLRSSSRSDIYSTTGATSTKYIGFRCCLSPVPNPQYLTVHGASGKINPVVLCTFSLEQVTGKRDSKLAFVNITGNAQILCFVDFSELKPRVYQYFDIEQVYCPAISLDGKWVAFCTRGEGSRDGSDIYIRKLDHYGSELTMLSDKPAFIPRWWVDPATFDTFLVYTNSAVLNSSSQWKTSATKIQKISNGKPVGLPQIIEPNGSFHGGLSKDKQFLSTGYQFLSMKNLSTNEQRILFTAPKNGKPADDTSQVCNVSITPDSIMTDRVLFLDFGSGKNVSTVTNSIYGVHEIIFMSNYNDDVLNWYQCPAGYKEWDHPEWSNNSRFAVASAKPVSDPNNRKDIFAIDLEKSIYTKIISGTDLWHPCLWISPVSTSADFSLAMDSVGFYDDPASHFFQSELARKFTDFWKFKDSIEILFLGSSYIQDGAAPFVFEPLFGYNMGFAEGGLLSIKHLLYDYALIHCKNLKAVVISVNICWFNQLHGDNAWITGSENTKGYNYDKNNNFWRSGIPSGFIEAVEKAPNPYNYLSEKRGWYESPSNGWGEDPPPVLDSWKWDLNDNYYNNIKTLKDIIADLQSREIFLLGVLFPSSPYYKNTPIYGSSGPNWETAHTIISQIQSLDSIYEYFTLYDAYNFGNNDFKYEDFSNASHLSRSGALKISTRLDSIVDEFLSSISK